MQALTGEGSGCVLYANGVACFIPLSQEDIYALIKAEAKNAIDGSTILKGLLDMADGKG